MGPILPLSMLPPGKNAIIRKVSEGEGLRARLNALGFIPETRIQVVRNDVGPLIINVFKSRIAIGRGMAHKILVEEITS